MGAVGVGGVRATGAVGVDDATLGSGVGCGKGATLGSGAGDADAGIGAKPGGTVEVAPVVMANMLASCLSAVVCSMLTGGSGDGWEGWRRAATRSLAAAMARSVEDAVGMTTWLGNQARVSEMRSAHVSLTQTR